MYVASVCFKHGPPRLTGVELEWLVHQAGEPPHWTPLCCAPPSARTRHPRWTPPPRPAPCRWLHGHRRTRWPGGAGQPAAGPFGALVRTVAADAEHLHKRLDAIGFAVSPLAADPLRPPRRVLDLPRYRAMEHRFDRVGPWGRSGMCSTAAVQVCVDAGEGADVVHRWAAVHALGPVLVAAFANSPVLHGRRTGWKSSRLAAWLALDPQRTAPPAPTPGDQPCLGQARARHRAAVRPQARRRMGRSTRCHVRRLDQGHRPARPADHRGPRLPHLHPVPPVRPHGHLEVRYLDAQPGRRWALPAAVLAAVLSDARDHGPGARACEPAVGRWESAARHGLDDRVLRAAVACSNWR